MGLKNKHTYAYLTLAVLLLASNGYWLAQHRSNNDSVQTSSQESQYPYLSKRIFAENQNDIRINFQPLRKQLEQRFTALPPDTDYSFYFEYLPSGTSIRIGDDNELIAASLIKVPLVMNLYKASELQRVSLDKSVTITQQQLDDSYGDLWKKGAGTSITLREAAKLALTQSDNTATHVIFDAANGLLSEKEQSLAQLDIDQNLVEGNAVINAKSYTSILKSLYLSSYLDNDSSQEILDVLTQSTETRRLTGELPKDIKVAHKNGVYNAKWSESDCGIVYIPKRPYAICAMVGLPEDQANAFTADISRIVYDYTVNSL